jgi:hypothetical protein
MTWACRLLHLLDATMLVLMDRVFDGGDFLAAVAETKAQFLVRLSPVRRPPVLRHLPDGSFTSVTAGAKVRIIIARVTVTCHDGTVYGDVYRLATTLLDHREYPAGALIRLYQERWQHEITYLALRHTMLTGRVLRSGDPAGVKQEMWHCWPSTRHFASRWPTRSSPCPASTPTAPAARPPSRPRRTS